MRICEYGAILRNIESHTENTEEIIMAKKQKHPAWTLVEEYAAAAKAVATAPQTLTAAEEKRLSTLEHKIYDIAPSVPNKGMGEVLMKVADINGLVTRAKQRRDVSQPKQQPQQ